MEIIKDSQVTILKDDIISWMKSIGLILPMADVVKIDTIVVNESGDIIISFTEKAFIDNKTIDRNAFLVSKIEDTVTDVGLKNALLGHSPRLTTMKDVLDAYNSQENLHIKNVGQKARDLLRKLFEPHLIEINLPKR